MLGQSDDIHIKVYDFDEGLSHRNVFKIQQDTNGFIWAATINGLNRFDGYNFIQFNSQDPLHAIPYDVISDMSIDKSNQIWLANPDFLTLFNPQNKKSQVVQIKQGDLVRRESQVPYNLYIDSHKQSWMAVYNEKSGNTNIQILHPDGQLEEVLQPDGQYPKRPIIEWNGSFFIGAFENELWQLDRQHNVISKQAIPLESADRSSLRIIQLQEIDGHLWMLTANGKIFEYLPDQAVFRPHPINQVLSNPFVATAFLIEDHGDIWIGGRGILLHYNALSKKVTNYDNTIRQTVKNTCIYRQFFLDQTGVIWVASDFGMIKIVKSDDLFLQYLSGGSEYCSDVYCSTRGITEDELGRIYMSYYNSIHLLDPVTNAIRPLFPSNDYFNFPFGIQYHRGAIWTGNGLRIDLTTLKVDTIFSKPNVDLGVVLVDQDQELWFGYQHWLYIYNTDTKNLRAFEDTQGQWDSLAGRISHLFQRKDSPNIWISTISNGVFKVDKNKGRLAHYSADEDSPIQLTHNRINAAYEDKFGYLWLASANGLNRLDLKNEQIETFTTKDGLPNSFINGLLSEGDTCMWVSTDNGLSRFCPSPKEVSNFFVEDGLSANEFNRISFYKAANERMYFGGLNGVNAFFPGDHFKTHKDHQQEAVLLLTSFTRLDGGIDSLSVQNFGLKNQEDIYLTYQDKLFTFSFTLADYRNPSQNTYSFMLEGFENTWSSPNTINSVRYNNIPAGNYTFRVKARAGQSEWSKQELAIPIHISEAYYNTWPFRILCVLLILGSIWAIMRYRIILIKKREKELEGIVKARTQELEKEKQKSEELLLNILPAETANELKTHGFAKAKRHELVTVMFSDFKNFSRIAEQLEPEDLVAKIDFAFRAFDEIIDKYGLEKIKTVGDAYLCVGGISSDDSDEAMRVVSAALEIQEFLKANAVEKKLHQHPYFEARLGIHTGPLVAGIVGIKKFAYDIWGDTVNIASRMETNGAVGKVNISTTTFELIQDRFHCKYHSQFTENNADIGMYFVLGPKDDNGVPSLNQK
ncbi:MAG: hypothetical protein DHS20C18_11760 [Saprospiraceae bacterium]|nr:MAG: hypothetical protein DHS20C18_11760 [Saprospiraceae bacterium]